MNVLVFGTCIFMFDPINNIFYFVFNRAHYEPVVTFFIRILCFMPSPLSLHVQLCCFLSLLKIWDFKLIIMPEKIVLVI